MDEYFLATTALDDFWDKERPILFLGEWCLPRYLRKKATLQNYQFLPFPWDDEKRLSQAMSETTHLYQWLSPLLSEHLNHIHHVNHTQRYWRILIGPWLKHYIDCIYDKYHCLLNAMAFAPTATTLLLDHTQFVTPRDLTDHIKLICDDAYNLQLYSQVLIAIGLQFPSKKIRVRKNMDSPVKQSILRKAKQIAAHSLQRLIALRKPTIIMSELMLPEIDTWKLILKSRGKVQLFQSTHTNRSQQCATHTLRSTLNALPTRTELEKILVNLLPTLFPLQYLEGYQELCRNTHQQKAKIFLSSGSWYANESFKAAAARACQQQTILIGTQHGGGYGMMHNMPAEEHERAVTDHYYTWGWKENKNTTPLPSLRLSSITQKLSRHLPNKKNQHLYFVGTGYPKYLFRFQSTPLGSQMEEYFDWQHRFFHHLQQPARHQVLMRLYPEHYGFHEKEYLAETFPHLQFDEAPSLYPRLLSARLIVIDHCMTTMIEALRLNLPTILFWNRAHWKLRKTATTTLESLYNAGILYDTPEAAAQAVNRVYDDPAAWWQQEEIQQARNTFCERYGVADAEWANTWRTALNKY